MADNTQTTQPQDNTQYVAMVSPMGQKWNIHPDEVEAAKQHGYKPDISGAESFARGGAQGLSLGFADEIAGQVKPD